MKKYNYHGNSLPFAAVLCHSKDYAKAESLLEELEKTGLKLCLIDESAPKERILKKACSVIAVLTENFYSSENLLNAYIKSGSFGKEIISLRADETEMPETLANFSYSKNSLNLSKLSAKEAAKKVRASDALKEPKVTEGQTAAFKGIIAAIVCAAVAAAAAIVLIMVSSNSAKEPEIIEEPFNPGVYGITQDDIQRIKTLAVIGGRVEYSTDIKNYEDYINHVWHDDEQQYHEFFDVSTGALVERGGGFEDLSFITKLPNIRNLIIAGQDAGELPDLSRLKKLEKVYIVESGFNNIEGLRNCNCFNYLNLSLENLEDISPLTDCAFISELEINKNSLKTLDGFHPESLSSIMIYKTTTLSDITSLAGCPKLRKCQINCLRGCPEIDFSPLSELKNLDCLIIETYNFSFDIGILSELKMLSDFDLSCGSIKNMDQISNCAYLKRFAFSGNSTDKPYIDLSALGKLKKLNDFAVQNAICSLDFLKELSQSKDSFLKFEVHDCSCDYSGLQNIAAFDELHVNLMRENGNALLDAIAHANIGKLHLINADNIDITKIPENVTKTLKFEHSSVSSLKGLPCKNITELNLYHMPNLSSLEGLEDFSDLITVDFVDCVRLSDYEVLYDKELAEFNFKWLLTLPDFSKLKLSKVGGILGFETNEGMHDLSCLDALPDEVVTNGNISVKAVSNEINNINALSRFHGFWLRVSPNLEEQAKDLVNNGNFARYELEYPEEGWSIDNVEISLNSLDELDTLPDALLRRVTALQIAGDTLYDETWHTRIETNNNSWKAAMENYDTDERVEAERATNGLDIESLSKLTGLRKLTLVCQKTASLEGIQNLSNLKQLAIVDCDIPDYSAIFALDSIEELQLCGKNINSLEGIENLYNLVSLDIQTAEIKDLSPIADIPFSSRVQEEGFSLSLPLPWVVNEKPADLSALAAVPKYKRLNINSYKGGWIEHLAGKDIEEAILIGSFNSTGELEEFAKSAGQIKFLQLKWSDNIDDLTCLNQIKGLEKVWINPQNEKAIHSLDGKDHNFELVIED